ncbi:Stk1 family PASTA domain-containing Ser/Thr kinase [Parvibacter caecicola]|uniref:Stk1 family PASTA domain-containing Ser/Thr kinase n=1 Tax=Parvibacter caecicola TaxID=747645 RepID=UPI0023F24311|nr:Stk1 family PASTA domain-containing Ser/Thr kinase [Parvibacter caecicola]
MTAQDIMTGRTFSGRYEIKDRIGIGGMAEVYRAVDNVLGRVVAVKVMLPQYAADVDFTRRFRQEAASAANLQSPYIVNVYDWGQDGQTYFIVMEFVRGSDLKTAIQQRGAINQRKVAEIGAQVCQALTVAHNQDIIHRDIKPQNIMVQPDGNVKVMDFGIARAKNSVEQKTSSVLGTAHYISPEQAQGKELTSASDIYSLGIVLYEAATGKLPFDGPDAVSVALMQVKDMPVPPRDINPKIDPGLESIIMCALAKNPAERFATANDMRLALNDYLAGRPVNLAAVAGMGAAATAMLGGAAATNLMNRVPENGTQVMPAVEGAAGNPGTQTMKPVDAGRNRNSYRADSSEGPKKGPIIALAIVAALVVIGVIVFIVSNGSAKQVDVPDVTGQSLAAATKALEDAGLEVGNVNRVTDDTQEPNTVTGQDPEGGKQAPEGSRVNLTVTQATETFELPTITDMTPDQAQNLAAQYGFVLQANGEKASDDIAEGMICVQSPEAGTPIKKGDTVTYIVSSGPDSVTVPNVIDDDEATATSKLEKLGFQVKTQTASSTNTDEGCVMIQSPTDGEKVKKGSTVTITISTGPDKPETKNVPDVKGYSEGDAAVALENAEFKYSVTYENSDTVPGGSVIRQYPDAGTALEPGKTVNLTISSGPAQQPDPSGGNNGNGNGNGNDGEGGEGDGGQDPQSE